MTPNQHRAWLAALAAGIGMGTGVGGAWAQASAPEAPGTPPPTTAPTPQPGPPKPAPAPAPAAPAAIEVTAKRDAVDQRRLSTAAKIIVTREDIEQFGDQNLGEVMKRLPGVTLGGRPGRGGAVRMRGMGGGYTQILIDGDRLPPGFSLDQLSPDQVERIEILRAPTAETGGRAIAGTINIVLREPLRVRGNDLRLGLSNERHGLRPNASWSRNEVFGDNGTWHLNATAQGVDQTTRNQSQTRATDLASGATTLQQQRASVQQDQRRSLNLNGRVQWQFGGGDHFNLQPFLAFSQGRGQNSATLEQAVGERSPSWDHSESQSQQRSANARLALQWRQRLGTDTRLELRGHVGHFQADHRSQLTQTLQAFDTPVLVQHNDTRVRDRAWGLNGKLSQSVFDGHSLVAGLEAEGVRRQEDGLQRAEASNASVNGTPTAVDTDGDLQASTLRLAAYLQDEWEPAATVSAYAGLRWESLRTQSDKLSQATGTGNTGDARYTAANTSQVLTPMAHAVWRFNAPARDQLRLSLTRSYRPPSMGNLTSAPRFNTTDPVPGGNSALTPDRAGNPELRPELAQGLDLALEHYLAGGGVLSVSAFSRRIEGVIRQVAALETVAWADVPRWVSRPRNIGNASTQGLELDAKFRLEELVADAPALSLRGNLGLYRSAVDGIAGPDNRIDQQPSLSLNLGGDYRLRSLPLSLGLNWSHVPGYAVQQSAQQRADVDTTRVLDGYALWTITPNTKLRVSLSNIVPRHYSSRSSVVADGREQVVSADGPTERVLGLRLEMKL